MITSRRLLVRRLCAVALTGLTLSAAPPLHAHAQSRLSGNQVVGARVENVTATTLSRFRPQLRQIQGRPGRFPVRHRLGGQDPPDGA